MPTMSRYLCPAVLVLLGAGQVSAAEPAAPATPATVTVGSGTAGARLVAPGQVQAVRQAMLAAQAAGRITEVNVRSGEAVKRGQVLLRIDAPGALASAEAGTAQADAAAAQLASARADFERTRRLHDKQYVSDAALERAQAQLRAIEAQATAARAQARAAGTAAGWQELRAPYDGRVTSVSVAAGDLAAPGQPLVGVYAPGAMRVLADVPEEAAARLATEQPAVLDFQSGQCAAAPREAKAWTLVPAIDPRSRSIGVRVELPEVRDCLPGALVRVSLPVRGTGSAGLTVPRTAVVHRGELDAVYVVDANGRTMLRQVRLGEPSGEVVAVLAGLEAGERVVRDALRSRSPAATQGAAP